MHARYDDILSRIPEEPQWWDEHAVPRFCLFEPRLCADIHCSEAVLAEIACQNCGKLYRVALSRGEWVAEQKGRRLCDDIVSSTLHYGDPPQGCCNTGASENSIPRRVVEYWRRHHPENLDASANPRRVIDSKAYHEWRRDPSFEIEIAPDWAR
jgi:hypothetical protein